MKVFIAGNMARDAVMAERLADEGCELYIGSEILNPSLVNVTARSGGHLYNLSKDGGKITDPDHVTRAVAASEAELFLTHSDEALANGVVDRIAQELPGVLIASPDRESARIEWDKFEARDIIQELDEEQGTTYNPVHFRVSDFSGLVDAMDYFESSQQDVAVKPRGLTGGKGVKVMGPHLQSYAEASNYAASFLKPDQQSGVIIEEKIEGHEFTIQGFTDGTTLIAPPVTYDYPYREDGDKGPGTGGMGSFTMPAGEQLPFLADADYLQALHIMKYMLREQKARGRDFKGVLYGSFFKTDEGLKVVEFNARMGDPEGLNIVDLLSDETSLKGALHNIAKGTLSERAMHFKRLAAAAVYLVSPDYAYREFSELHEFGVDVEKIAAAGCRAYFGAAVRTGAGTYRTSGSSRTVALTSVAATPWEARSNIQEAIHTGVSGPLQYRQDVADHDYIRIDLSR